METNKEKDFDAVKMMREIRKKISDETANMSLDELKIYMSEKTKFANLRPLGQHESSQSSV